MREWSEFLAAPILFGAFLRRDVLKKSVKSGEKKQAKNRLWSLIQCFADKCCGIMRGVV